jgi:hypothetical protein
VYLSDIELNNKCGSKKTACTNRRSMQFDDMCGDNYGVEIPKHKGWQVSMT